MKLPAVFEARMAELLQTEYPVYRESMEQPPFLGLRVNTLKISVEDFLKIASFRLTPIPWVPEGFYYEEGDRPTKHPFYHAGLYYIQEPSAMFPVTLLDPPPGAVVLDTCAAPGGKSCQIAARLGGEGLLLTNDISASRAKALLHNIEISGIRNAVVLCEDPPRLVPRLARRLTHMLVDAPCSGEGMFRKADGVIKAWGPDRPAEFRAMQDPLLEAAAGLLAPGGALVYSTCTFNRLENEEAIGDFLGRHGDFSQDPREIPEVSPGLPDATGAVPESLYRLWPQRHKGEGHFAARLLREGAPEGEPWPLEACNEPPAEFASFAAQYLPAWQEEGVYRQFGERLLLMPRHRLDLAGLRVIRAGWYLGDVKKGRFEPSQALALGLKAVQFAQRLDFDPEDPELIRYIKGETLHRDCPRGWILVSVAGYPLGWAKGLDGMLKNHYPAAWRRLD